jgi:dihydroorotate dehydrogenase electron transfer subunit
MKIHKAKLSKEIESAGSDCFKLYLEIESDSEIGQPGQFYQIQIPNEKNNLRVPISIYDINNNEITFLIKIVGEKTRKLKNINKREIDRVSILGPIGNTFPIEPNSLLVSGGIGYAPINFLHKQTGDMLIHGGRTSRDVSYPSTQNKANIICTEDGSIGERGLVTEVVEKAILSKKYDRIVACGPKGMLIALSDIASRHDIPLFISLEEYMACGVGVCYGCAIRVKDSYLRLCMDGPVFNAKDIVWE